MAYSTSDPFTKLPAELRLQIIVSTECMKTILRLIRASPSMFQQYLKDKKYIKKNVITYDKEMMQNAMAIVLMPKWHQTGQDVPVKETVARAILQDWPIEEPPHSLSVPDEKTLATARKVLRLWSMGQLPHATSDAVASQLNELHYRILVFAEDYITKATSSFPPRDYRCLPQVQWPSANRHLMFKGVKVTPRFHLADLTAAEKKRVFKAFLRYELLCRAGALFRDDTYSQSQCLPKRWISAAESDNVVCVRSYYRSIYGAIFAQCTDAQLPSMPEELVFPDTFLFDGNMYAHKLHLFDESWNDLFPDFTSWFSRLGIDRLTDFLSHDMAKEEGREALKLQIQHTWFTGGRKHGLGFGWPSSGNIFHAPESNDNIGNSSHMYRQLKGSFKPEIRLDIALQRAWSLFDDIRLYPQETHERPNFPSHRFLEEKRMQANADELWLSFAFFIKSAKRSDLAREERIRAGMPEFPRRRFCTGCPCCPMV